MKRTTLLLTLFVLLIFGAALVACSQPQAADPDATLAVVVAGSETIYSRTDLEALEPASVEADGETYHGVALGELLRDAGVDPTQVETVSAVASDGFSASYDGELILNPETIVAYAAGDGDLPNDEQPFRMVLPGQPGRLNVRMLARIEVGS